MSPEQDQPQQEHHLPATMHSAIDRLQQKFQDLYANARGGGIENMREAVMHDTVDAVRSGDLASAQFILESPYPKLVDVERRDVLRTLHEAQVGTPTPQQKAKALQEIQKAILQSKKEVDPNNRSRILENLHANDSHKIDEALIFVEAEITEAGVMGETEKRESLRIARNILHEKYKVCKEMEDLQAGVKARLSALVGSDNEMFSREDITDLSKRLYGEAVNDAHEILGVAEETDDPYEQAEMLQVLRNRSEILGNPTAMQEWRNRRKIIADRAKERAIARARAEVASARDPDPEA